jgi:2-oxoglutarate ferredoxin oxidoreductase subunit beta
MGEKLIYDKPKCLTDRPFHYCPGCGHGIVHKLIGELIDEMELKDKFVGIAPVGCSVFAYWYFDCDFTQVPHGRAPAVATGVKRVRPDLFVLSYQGDGDLAAIGTAEIIHAANRGENITVVFINNAIYGMTGGQMAPTTLLGQKTQTTPYGRDVEHNGYPIRVSEMLATLSGATYIERTHVADPKGVISTKKALKKAFNIQLNNQGFSLIEILSSCPTNWGMNPVDAMQWVKDKMIPYYPLGVFKDKTKEEVK